MDGGLEEGGETPETHDVVLAHGEQHLAAGVVVHVVHDVPADRKKRILIFTHHQ